MISAQDKRLLPLYPEEMVSLTKQLLRCHSWVQRLFLWGLRIPDTGLVRWLY